MSSSPAILGEPQQVQVSLPLEPGIAPTLARVGARMISHRQRMWRGGLAWALCWGLALVFLPIPIVHFVLVPAFVITGPIVAWKRFSKTAVIESGEVGCIRCQKPVPIEEPQFGWPVGLFCKACGVTLRLQPVGEA